MSNTDQALSVHIPGLDGIGGTLRIVYREGGPNRHQFQFALCQWDTDRDPDPENQPDLAENLRRQAVVEAAAAAFVDSAGNLAFVYDPSADDHLRIYGIERTPRELVARYLANRPPLEHNWGLLDLRGEAGPDLVTYYEDETPICKREFSRVETTENGVAVLTTTETPSWARNDGEWVAGPTKTQVYRGKTQIDKITAARREKAYDRLRQDFTAYNKQRVRDGILTPEEMVAWLRSAEAENVLALLRLLMFEAAIASLPGMSGTGATEEFKTTWAAKLQAEL